jgi:hypothetical protein
LLSSFSPISAALVTIAGSRGSGAPIGAEPCRSGTVIAGTRIASP